MEKIRGLLLAAGLLAAAGASTEESLQSAKKTYETGDFAAARDGYEAVVRRGAGMLSFDTYDDALGVACAPDEIRGYEGVKLASAQKAEAEVDKVLARLEGQTLPLPRPVGA